MKTKSFCPNEQAYRNKKYAALHAQSSKMGWDDAQYRDWLQSNYGVRSAKNLSTEHLSQAADLLFTGGVPQKQAPSTSLRQRGGKYLGLDAPGRPRLRGGEGEAQLSKIEALLGEAGKTWAYGLAILQRQSKVERWEWARSDDLKAVIAALSYHLGVSKRPTKRRQARQK